MPEITLSNHNQLYDIFIIQISLLEIKDDYIAVIGGSVKYGVVCNATSIVNHVYSVLR